MRVIGICMVTAGILFSSPVANAQSPSIADNMRLLGSMAGFIRGCTSDDAVLNRTILFFSQKMAGDQANADSWKALFEYVKEGVKVGQFENKILLNPPVSVQCDASTVEKTKAFANSTLDKMGASN